LPAQNLYDTLVKTKLSPALREMGFIGSGGRYSLRAEACWSLLGLQKSAYSDREEVRFTVNLLVVNKGVWASMRSDKDYLPEKPAPGALYGQHVAQARLGTLLPHGEDTWWRVYTGVNLEAVAEDLLTGIELYGLPWLRAQMGRHCGRG
jgi:hypothetical protein